MRTTRRRLVLVALFLVAAAVAVPSIVGLASAGDDHSMTAVAAAATARFHDLDAAQHAGYGHLVTDLAGLTCIADTRTPSEGGMGVHYVDMAYLLDGGVIDPTKPEALVYAPNADGQPKLAALEYILFASEWPGGVNDPPPTLFGGDFIYTSSPNRYDLPAFWALHVWIWHPNPSGLFKAWNPRVHC
jgi:hypothetical protein